MQVIDWVLENKAWLFSGLLIVVPLAIIGRILAKRSIVQKQKAGHNSVNIQATGNVSVADTTAKPKSKDE